MSGHARSTSNNAHIEEELEQIRRYEDFSTTGKKKHATRFIFYA
jgi:hypothetical protein